MLLPFDRGPSNVSPICKETMSAQKALLARGGARRVQSRGIQSCLSRDLEVLVSSDHNSDVHLVVCPHDLSVIGLQGAQKGSDWTWWSLIGQA